MAAFDAAQITQAVRELAARHEQLHERLSRVIGPVAGYESMTLPQLAAYGLERLHITVPDDDDDPAVVCLEQALQGRSGGAMGAGMDSVDNIVTRYLKG